MKGIKHGRTFLFSHEIIRDMNLSFRGLIECVIFHLNENWPWYYSAAANQLFPFYRGSLEFSALNICIAWDPEG